MSILLKNAKVFDGRSLGSECEDILVKDGVIARRGSGFPEDGAEVYDLGGKLLCPGFNRPACPLPRPGVRVARGYGERRARRNVGRVLHRCDHAEHGPRGG